MKENSEPLPIYIAVDSSKVVRCMWCGLALSDDWRQSKFGIYYSKGKYGTYCSKDCHDAGRAVDRILNPLFVVFVSVLILVSAETLSSGVFAIGVAVAVVGSCMFLYYVKVGHDSRKRVPRNSRRDDAPSDMVLSKTISSGISCPRCNVNIDVRKIGEDRVYNCEYCGASGTIELLRSQ